MLHGLIASLTLLAGLVGVDYRAQDVAPEWHVDYERSTLVVKLKKAGLLRFLGHEHGIVPGAWSARVRFDPDDLAASSISVEVSAPELVIDSVRARELAGVDPDGPSGEEVVQIQADMLSDDYLDAQRFPSIEIESTSLRWQSEAELHITATLTLHGEARPIEIGAVVEPDGAGYVVRGDFEIKQRDFGIEPASIAGVVKVANEVEIRFEVYAASPAPVSRTNVSDAHGSPASGDRSGDARTGR